MAASGILVLGARFRGHDENVGSSYVNFRNRVFARHCGVEILPGAAVESDDELLDYARQKGSTVYHATCTCKMGSDRMAVVDDQLRAHGLEGLRVVDASVMPAVISTNTNAPTTMIAEKGATILKGAAHQRLAA